MDLYLIRHADAVPHGTPGFEDDDRRPLTDLGRDQAERIGQLLARLEARVDVDVTSPLARARETTALLLPQLPAAPRVVEFEEIGREMRPRRTAKFLGSQQAAALAVVGHQPTLGAFLAWLIGGKKARIDLAKGGVARLDAKEIAKGAAALRWLVTPEWF